MTILEAFCDKFTPNHIQVFIDVLENPGWNKSYTKEPIRKLTRGIQLTQEFIKDGKAGFPHGGTPDGIPRPVEYLVGFLEDLLSKITEVLLKVYEKLEYKVNDSYTLLKGYDKKWYPLAKKYAAGLHQWEELLEPIILMLAEPVNRPNRSYKTATSRVVRTFNRFQKHANVPVATPYTGYNQWTSRNEMPLGEFIVPSYSPRRTRKTKPRKVPQGTRF